MLHVVHYMYKEMAISFEGCHILVVNLSTPMVLQFICLHFYNVALIIPELLMNMQNLVNILHSEWLCLTTELVVDKCHYNFCFVPIDKESLHVCVTICHLLKMEIVYGTSSW